jgi:radical SAM superfamily enzyme YgiQ (UPF0313 family)
MKIVFVDNFFYLRSTDRVQVIVSPQLGLMSLSAILEEAGHDVCIVDPKLVFAEGKWNLPEAAFYEAWADAVIDAAPDVIGFTALGRTLPHVIEAAGRVKARRPDLPILIGGPHATILGPELLEPFDCIDIVVRYEAETIIRDVMECVHTGRDMSHIPNLVFRNQTSLVTTIVRQPQPDMDALPFPAYHLYPRDKLMGKELAVEAGRGCPFACTFCSTAKFFQRRYRLKSNERLIEEIELLRNRFGTSVVDLNHDLFGLNKKMLRDFCSRMVGRGIYWKCSMRPDTIDLSMLNDLVRAGCVSIYFGVESGSDRMQEIIAKRLDLEETVRCISSAINVGLVCTASFIAGFPEETEEDLAATLDLIGRLAELSPERLLLQLHVLSPEPGSDLADRERSISFDGIGPEMDDLIDTDLVARYPTLFSVFYHFRSQLSRTRTLYSSAFVTFLMPEIGRPLVTLIINLYFDGRLSLLLGEIISVQNGSTASFPAIVDGLWSGLEKVIERKLNVIPHIGELLRLSRILAECRRSPPGGTEESQGDEPSEIIVASFKFPVAEIAKNLLKSQIDECDLLKIAPVRTWYIFRKNDLGEVDILLLDAEKIYLAQEIYDDYEEYRSTTPDNLAMLGAITLTNA